jgi:hypothetical protein
VAGSRFAIVLLLLAAPSGADDAASRPAVSLAEAQSLGRKLDILRQQTEVKGRRETVQVTEGELTSYLNLTYAPKMPPGLSDVDVRFESQRIRAKGVLDLERVRGNVPPPSPWSPLAYLKGKVPVECAGRLQTGNGYGTFEVEQVSIASIPVPMMLLEEIVSSATKKPSDPDGVDIHAPFLLPYKVNRVRVEPARVFLDF